MSGGDLGSGPGGELAAASSRKPAAQETKA
jgi:hypothetical protein